jgi:tetratricopeptide (TPR) repeat protein
MGSVPSEEPVLDAACALKLGAWAFTVLAAALNAGELEFVSLLAQVGAHSLEAGEALRERPRDVVRKTADRLARRIEREHREWLIHEFGSDPTGQADMAGMIAAIPDVLVHVLSDLPAIARADLDPLVRVDQALARIGRTDERFRPDTAGARLLRCLIAGAYAAARQDAEFARAMTQAVHQVLLERTTRLQAGQQRIEAALSVGGARLHLQDRHHRKAAPRNLRELLMAERRATDLVGRQEELRPLKLWLAMKGEDRDIAVHCLTGRAGAGKTRLAIELCEWAESAGWSTGFVGEAELARFHEHHHPSEWRWQQPTLVVVDYAAVSSRVLRAWLAELARGAAAPDELPLRILLLERFADRHSGWWEDLIRPGGYSGPGPDVLIDRLAPLALRPLRAGGERRALLAQAMILAAPLLNPPRPPPPLPPPGTDLLFDRRLDDDTIDTEPLFLVMAGIVAVEQGAPTALALTRLDLARDVADAERSRLQRLARAAGTDEGLVLHLAACITLQAGCGRNEATDLINEERRSLGDTTPLRTDQFETLLRDALAPPDGGGIDAVRPDLIGEAFLLKELRPASRQVEAVERAFRRVGQRVISTVVRTAQDHAQGMAAHASVSWLDHLARLIDDPFTLMAIGTGLPVMTLALREAAAEIYRRIVVGLTTRATVDPDLRPVLADWTDGLANRLSDLGQRAASLAAAQEAVRRWREITVRHPDAFAPNLARSLHNLVIRLRDSGQREAALAAARGALELHRALAARRTDDFGIILGSSLNNLANCLGDLHNHEAALPLARESVELYRVLATDDCRSFLAGSLVNLASRLSNLDQGEEALAPACEAVELYRTLAAQKPDAFRPELAGSLSNLASRLSDLGERETALAVAHEAVELFRALAAERPDAFGPKLAMSSYVLAQCLNAVDRPDDSVAAGATAITELFRHFKRNGSAFAEQLAWMTQDYVRRCVAMGREPDRQLLGAVEQALAGTRKER